MPEKIGYNEFMKGCLALTSDELKEMLEDAFGPVPKDIDLKDTRIKRGICYMIYQLAEPVEAVKAKVRF